MQNTIDIDELHAEVNRHLPIEQQIQKGDPMYAGMLMNKIALASHVHFLQEKLDEALERIGKPESLGSKAIACCECSSKVVALF